MKIIFSKAYRYILILALHLPFFADAQNLLSGTVTNSGTQETVAGAVIRIEDSFLVAITDNAGHFEFSSLRQSTAVLTISHLSFAGQHIQVTLPATPLDIHLVPRIISAEEVTVTALRADEHSGFAYSSLNKEEIESLNLGQDLPYLLNLTPSAVATSDAGTGIGYTSLRIRGSDATRVNVTINGVPVNDAESHSVYWVDLPDFAASIENLQIQRGIGTSTNGAGAFGASINIQSAKISDIPYGTISSSAGSYHTTKNSFSFGTGMLNKFSFDGRFSIINSDGFIDRSASDLKSIYLSGGLTGTKSSLRFIMYVGSEKTSQAWYGVPEAKLRNDSEGLMNHYLNNLGSLYFTADDSINLFSSDNRKYNYYTYNNQTDNYHQDNYQLHYSFNLSKYWNANAALHYTMGSGYYEEYRKQENLGDYGIAPEVIGGDTISSCDLVRQRWLQNDFYGGLYSLQYRKKKLGFIFGGAWNYYAGEHFGEVTWAQYAATFPKDFEYYHNDAGKYDFNSYAKASYQATEKLNLFADVQYRTIDYSFFGYDNYLEQDVQHVSLNFFNPKAGFHYRVSPKEEVYLSAGMGHKEPIRDDYTDAPADTRPLPESMLDLEAGYRLNADKIQFAANLFYMMYTDQLVVTGYINDIGLYPRQNVPESFRRGIELEGAWQVSKVIKFAFNTTLSENKIKEFKEYVAGYDAAYNYLGQAVNTYQNTDLAFSPAVTGAGILTCTPVKNLELNLTGKYVGQQYLDNTQNGSRKLNPYFISDLRISYEVTKVIGNSMGFTLAVYNLFNRVYESNGYTYSYNYNGSGITENYYYPQAGTNVMAGIRLKF